MRDVQASVILYIQPTRMRRIKMQCLRDMVCKCKRASKRVQESVCDGGTRESLMLLCSRHIICVLGFPMVTTPIVTTFMKPTPRYFGVFTLKRAPCTLTKKTRVSFPIFPIRIQRGVNVLACGISASNGWRSACDLTLMTEIAGDHRLASSTPLCRWQLQHALSCLWVVDQCRLQER